MKLTPREPLVIGTAPATDHEGGTVLTNSDARKGQIAMEETTLPAVLATEAEPAPPRTPPGARAERLPRRRRPGRR
jgi:hypothetical protein